MSVVCSCGATSEISAVARGRPLLAHLWIGKRLSEHVGDFRSWVERATDGGDFDGADR